MEKQAFLSRVFNELEPRPNANGQTMTMPMVREFCRWGMFLIEDDNTRYKFYDEFYKAYYAGKIANADAVAEIGALVTNGKK